MQLKDTSLLKQQVFINGEWLAATDQQTFAVTNPATGETIANVSSATEQQVEHAVNAAEQALIT